MTSHKKKKSGESKNIQKNKGKLIPNKINIDKVDIIKPIATPRSTDGTSYFAYITNKFSGKKNKGGKFK